MRGEGVLDSHGNGGGASAVETRTNEVEKTRIYVGGLGETVTEDDLRKTFSALGKIESVDIVRTKGRSLAYLDFIPSSDKSLSKLFSTYNGCMWKGGRLRLEKAKEHYLLRLKREWKEEGERASDASESNTWASESMLPLEKPKKPSSLDKMHLQIYFPKLRKVKSVPWSGTGKHKYSFQRIPVPPLPSHFCDCPEHYIPPPPRTNERTFSDPEIESGGINEEELNIMDSVMKKLLEKEDLSETAGKESNLPNERVTSDGSVSDLPADESEDHMTDEDNLIINVMAGENDMRQSLEAIMANQKQASEKSQTSEDRLPRNMRDSRKKTLLPHKKKRKLSDSEESGENHRTRSHLRLTTPEDGASDVKLGSQQLESNSSRKQKSVWKSLIGQRGNSPFSISDIIPNVTLQKEDEPGTSDLDVPSIMDEKEGEHRTADLDVPAVMDKKEEPKTADLDMAPITDMKKQNLEKHGNVENESCKSKNLEIPADAPAKPKEVSNKVARGAAWLAKSSWTQLVGTTINNPFSISQVLPGLTYEKQDQLQHNNTFMNSTEIAESTLKPDRKGKADSSDAQEMAKKDLVTIPLASDVIPLPKHDHNPPGTRMEQKSIEEKLTKNSEVSASSIEKTQPSKSLVDFEFSEICPFMRTDASMKEWRKRKGAKNNASKKKKCDMK